MQTLLIVDDELDMLKGLQRTIDSRMDVKVLIARDYAGAVSAIETNDIDLVVTDIVMPGRGGIDLLKFIKDHDPLITVVMMTGYGTIEIAVETLKAGAYDFIKKPFEMNDLIRILEKGLERNSLLRENRRLTSSLACLDTTRLVMGSSPKSREALERIRMLAATDVTVLITGETGTGKDLAARIIHETGSRKDRAFVTVNCPALPEGLLESELFGHRKGAFTDARETKKGLFDLADMGTIFLDEIGDLSLSLQTKLLRVLQNKEIHPLGQERSHQVDVRIIAATNQGLGEKIRTGQFRADLFYRLNVASLVMPPLRDIREDIPILVSHFLAKAAASLNVQPKAMSPGYLEELTARDWPGNIRELENTIIGLMATTSGSIIDPRQIETSSTAEAGLLASGVLTGSYLDHKNQLIERFTKTYLHQLFIQTRGNVSLSAQISGIQRQSLQKIINRYNITVDEYRRLQEPQSSRQFQVTLPSEIGTPPKD
ncbi:MAG: sigma-54 dependent transcriptional regulator [Pseudomonadota bacterium]